ncbi:2-hydroxyacid dehydrogenase [Oceanotoga teriensis]|jgi:D-lactate dehydrogenase|uniref:D-lactate dehydrogenase n=1 Tax=Oceanotoga teriensis TaxID=515440 RepID=A0AA45C5A1_9BACT|nr:2-hydroxyacid dehydrogenase [Oceanotoga teriensis]MDO7976142.1 2-hydroxyacid dehydrogenase [Oceanotoga teriensis]PWJ88494.1 D-lactate dehydrogenase [Oceanotoga teriensis]
MKIAIFSTKEYDIEFLNKANENFGNVHELKFFETKLNKETALLANDFEVVSAFVNDDLSRETIEILSRGKTKLIAQRAAGYNNIDLKALKEFGIKAVRVPAYSPNAVAEYTIAMMLSLNRKIHRAYDRAREKNFSLKGLMGFDMKGKTVGIIGTGKIGMNVARILKGFDCNIIAYDKYPNPDCEEFCVEYTDLDSIFEKSDIITIHSPLVPETYHIINKRAISLMKDGVMIINTSRGELFDTQAVIDGIKSRKIGSVGMDVYEEESDIFFEDLSDKVVEDDLLSILLTFPNVIVTGHQAFFTDTAMNNIAYVTLENISEYEKGLELTNEIKSK